MVIALLRFDICCYFEVILCQFTFFAKCAAGNQFCSAQMYELGKRTIRYFIILINNEGNQLQCNGENTELNVYCFNNYIKLAVIEFANRHMHGCNIVEARNCRR